MGWQYHNLNIAPISLIFPCFFNVSTAILRTLFLHYRAHLKKIFPMSQMAIKTLVVSQWCRTLNAALVLPAILHLECCLDILLNAFLLILFKWIPFFHGRIHLKTSFLMSQTASKTLVALQKYSDLNVTFPDVCSGNTGKFSNVISIMLAPYAGKNAFTIDIWCSLLNKTLIIILWCFRVSI